MANEKLNREATIKNILEKCEDGIDMEAFNKNANAERGDEFLIDSALYWETEIVYQ